MAAFVPALISGISALAGGLLNRPKTTEQTTNSSTEQSANNQFATSPTYDPFQLAMRNFLLTQFYNRTNPEQIRNTVDSYVGQGVNGINQSSNTSEQSIKNMLASRGLSYSGAATAPLVNAEQSRIGQITDLRNQAPLLRDQLQGKYLTDFGSFLSGLPTGTSGVGNTTSQSNQTSHTIGTDPGNPLGGAVSGLGSSLALMYGLGAFRGTNQQGNMNTSGGGGRS